MHVDYAREYYHKHKNPKYVDPASDLYIIKMLSICDLVDHAKEIGDASIKMICEEMQNTSDYRYNGTKNFKSRMTDYQRYTVARFLLHKYKTAIAVIAKVFKIDESKVELTDKEIKYL